MIGIVVVSHSAALAEAAVGLAAGLLPDHGVPVCQAAGAAGGFGTDAMAVAGALEAADSGDGVVVLCDLGSALLAAELALEFVDPALAARVRLSPGPLVEGLVAAVAAASGGAELSAVAAAAESALHPKTAHLTAAPTGGFSAASRADRAGALEVVLELGTQDGLHARPAAQLATLAAAADVDLSVTNLRTQGPAADGASMLELMALDARPGDRIRLVATGPDAGSLLSTALPLLTGRSDGP